jgi:hypothetical protein
MTTQGPDIATLVRRVIDCPADLLAHEPRIGGSGRIAVDAVVYDLLCDLGAPADARADLSAFVGRAPGERNRLRLVLVAAWLLYDEWFRARGDLADRALALLRDGLTPLAAIVDADKAVADADRREELVRLCLEGLALRPRGETEKQARDRRTALDSVERRRVVEATRAAEERTRRVREEMARKATEAAAAKATRE